MLEEAENQHPSPFIDPVGAYGLELRGIESARSLLVPAPDGWVPVEVVRRVGTASAELDRLGDDKAEIALPAGGVVVMDRRAATAVYTTPRMLGDAELVHPYATAMATIFSYWLGRESFHAGAFAVDRGGWVLLGEKESGKSSMLAWLALNGYAVLSDDVVAVEGTTALAGPRSVDLRAEPARYLGAGEALGVVGVRERWRLRLEPVEPELPIRGWIFLGWGDRVEASRLSGGRRLTELTRHRAVRVPPTHPEALVELASLPAWELRRPHAWESLPEAAERLLELTVG